MSKSSKEDHHHDLRGPNFEPYCYNSSDPASKWKKRSWTTEEDAYLIKLVQKYGPQKWTTISENLPGRIGKQCRERWHNHLNPDIKKEDWSDHEEWILFLAHKTLGNRWA